MLNDGVLRKITRFFGSTTGIVTVGLAIGVLAALLQKFGNPANMGVCVACFVRDITGAIGLHRTATVQYLRPEIIGVVLGALVGALVFGEYRGRGSSTPLLRLVLGFFAMIGALVFLGCPWRALLRLAGGDLNAIVALAGLVTGAIVASLFLKRGFSLGRSRSYSPLSGLIIPIALIGLLVLVFLKFSFKDGEAIFFSSKGPGASHAAVFISLGFSLLIGILAQRTRFCTVGAFRDSFLIRDFHLFWGVVALAVGAFAMNIIFNQFKAGFELMPISHSSHVWNFLSMLLAGLAFVLAGGCPGRQLVMTGEGDNDAALFVVGMVLGAAFAHNWFLASSPDSVVEGITRVGGPGIYGQVAVVCGIVVCLVIGFVGLRKLDEKAG